MRWDQWWKGLLAAVVGGAVIAGSEFQFGGVHDFAKLGQTMLVAAVPIVLAYVKSHPLPNGPTTEVKK